MRTTNLFIIIDESNLEVKKSKKGEVKKFKSEKEADVFASKCLEIWTVLHVNFNHPFIEHTL
jgi:hypothetical protein